MASRRKKYVATFPGYAGQVVIRGDSVEDIIEKLKRDSRFTRRRGPATIYKLVEVYEGE